mgnify:CR=1 FL=1
MGKLGQQIARIPGADSHPRQCSKRKVTTNGRNNGKCGGNDVQVPTTNGSKRKMGGRERCTDSSTHATGAALGNHNSKYDAATKRQEDKYSGRTKQRRGPRSTLKNATELHNMPPPKPQNRRLLPPTSQCRQKEGMDGQISNMKAPERGPVGSRQRIG